MTALLQGIVDGLSTGSIYMLLALGLSLVFSVMGLINFAYGNVIVWTGYCAALAAGWGLPYPAVILLSMLFAMLLSVAIGRFAFLPFAGAPPSTLLLASFGVALMLQALATMIFGDAPRVVPTPALLAGAMTVAGIRISVLQIVALGLAGAVLAGLDLLVNRTGFGIRLRAAAEDRETAALMGVDHARVLLTVFALTGLIAAIVAFAWFGQSATVAPQGGFNPTLKAFIAVVLGGLGTVRGAVIGGLALGLIETGLAATLGDGLLTYQQAFAFILIIAVLLIRPQGIAGRVAEISK